MADDTKRADDHWALDKRVPIGLLVGLLIQAGTAIWWASGMNKDITAMREHLQVQQTVWKEQISKVQDAVKELGDSKGRISVLEAQLIGVRDSQQRIERLLDRQIERQTRR